MALAPFFDKTIQSASTLLAGFDPAAFAEHLETQRVVLAFDTQAVSTHEGQAALDLATELLVRLYPALVLTALDDGGRGFVARLAQLATAINPRIAIQEAAAGGTVVLVVGATPLVRQAPTFYIGSDGWVARLSNSRPVGCGISQNPLGAAAAACLGAANVFRAVFAAQLPHGNADSEIALSLVDLCSSTATLTNAPLPDVIDLGETHLVGVGAIGHASVWCWERMPGLHGALELIDGERYDETNLQRYVGTTMASAGRWKVREMAAHLAQSVRGLSVAPRTQHWQEYMERHRNWLLQRVAVALDSAEDRIAVQGALPRRILNSWTQPENLGVSRHDFLDGACLACLYLPSEQRKSQDQLISETLGFGPDDLMLVRRLLDTGEPVQRELLERMAKQLRVPAEPLLEFEGQPLRHFYHRAICGGAVLSLGGSIGVPRPAEVPMAFQSALAGVLLAAEVILDATRLREEAGIQLPTRTEVDLLRPLGPHLSSPEQKHPSGRCLCQDEDYRSAYRSKWLESRP